MARPLKRVHITHFLGLGLAGEASSVPVRDQGQEAAAFFSDCRNLWAPAGKLTNDGIGYVDQGYGAIAGGGTIGADFRILAVLLKADGTRQLCGIADGKFWTQDAATAEWTMRASGLTAADTWTAASYFDRLFLASSSGVLRVWDGTTFRPWMISSPANGATATPTGTGSLTLVTGWSYLFTYYRSDDLFESPTNTTPAKSGAFASKVSVNLAAIPGTGQTGVDKIRIWRTTDGGGTYRLLATISNPGAGNFATYTDTTLDTALSIQEVTMITALDPLQARVVAVMGERLYLGRITDSNSKVYPWRVVFTYPGQPWRIDLYDYTDEIEGVVVAMVAAERGLVVWTPARAVAMIPVGGGAHTVQRLPWPGCVSAQAACEVAGSVAWIAPGDIFLGTECISDPPEGTSSLGDEARTIDPTNTWMLFVPRANSLLIGNGKTLTYCYDLTRKQWWKIGYGGTCAVLMPSDARWYTAPDNLVIASSLGSTIAALFGNSAGASPLYPRATIGPTDLSIDYRKRFRYAEAHVDIASRIDVQMRHDMEIGERSQSDVMRLQSDSTVLDVDFFLDQSMLESLSRRSAKFSIGDTGHYLTLELSEITGGGVFVVQAIDIYYQYGEFKDGDA